jgi:carboxylesterase type B
MIWFHGGWSVSGDANGLFGEYNGAVLARLHNLTVLSVQYRLALFGFLMLEGVTEDAGQAAPEALGFQDQALAMNWVQENSDNMDIAQTQVVLFGHNAGSWSVCNHVFRDQSAGLQSGAIMQSGYCEDTEGTQTKQ